jgi:hypothetical protein
MPPELAAEPAFVGCSAACQLANSLLRSLISAFSGLPSDFASEESHVADTDGTEMRSAAQGYAREKEAEAARELAQRRALSRSQN